MQPMQLTRYRYTHLELMRYKQHRLPLEDTTDALGEYVLSDVGVHSTQGVVQEVDVAIRVQRPRQADSLLLASAQVCSTLADLIRRG